MSRPPRPVLILLPLLIVAAAITFVLARRAGNGTGLEASGTVEATEADLGFPVAGRVDTVAAFEGDTVAAGAELARLDAAEIRARRAQAVAHVAASRAVLLELERGSRPEELAQARAAAAAADDRLAEAERDAERARALRADSLISEQAFDRATTAREVARHQAAQAREALRLVEAGPRRERVEAARAQLAAAEAAVATLDATLRNLSVRAPFAGLVTVRHHEPGEIVQAGSPALTVLNRDDRWVRIYVPETRIGTVRIGQPAEIRSDSHRGKVYPGTVVYVASEAEFTPKNVQTREERVKLVYSVKVRIAGDPGLELKPGMPADVKLDGAGR
jgi:HlyD family secretion protein